MRSLRLLIPLVLVLLVPHPRARAQDVPDWMESVELGMVAIPGDSSVGGLPEPLCIGESREIAFYPSQTDEKERVEGHFAPTPERDAVVLTSSHGEWSKPVEFPATSYGRITKKGYSPEKTWYTVRYTAKTAGQEEIKIQMDLSDPAPKRIKASQRFEVKSCIDRGLWKDKARTLRFRKHGEQGIEGVLESGELPTCSEKPEVIFQAELIQGQFVGEIIGCLPHDCKLEGKRTAWNTLEEGRFSEDGRTFEYRWHRRFFDSDCKELEPRWENGSMPRLDEEPQRTRTRSPSP